MALIEEMFQKNFGISAKSEAHPIPSHLPFYMTANRTFHYINIAGCIFLLVHLSEDEKFGVIAYEKQLMTLMESTNTPVAYDFPFLTRTQRNALIERQIPFTCFPDQMYLPFLGLSLRNHFTLQKRISHEKMMPSTQVLFLYFLYEAKETGVNKQQAAHNLRMTKMSITRASEQLLALNLITQKAHGREQIMKAVCTGKNYYELGKPFMINPIQRVSTVVRTQETLQCPYAGESALSYHSMLSEPPICVVAIDKKSDIGASFQTLDEQWNTGHPCIKMEYWKYDPFLFVKDGAVDPASLAASLAHHPDERIQSELEAYMEEVEW